MSHDAWVREEEREMERFMNSFDKILEAHADWLVSGNEYLSIVDKEFLAGEALTEWYFYKNRALEMK